MMYERKKTIILIFLGFCLLFTIIVGKAFRIQVIDKSKLQARYQKQIFREIKVYPRRGNIFDRNGEPLAINIQTYSIFTIPKHLEGVGELQKVAKIIPSINFKYLKKKILKRNKFTWIARKVSLTESQLFLLKKIKGIYVEPVPKRLYPNNELLSQTLGFVGLDNKGLAGLEHYFDTELKGTPKTTKYIKDAKGRPVKFEIQDLGSKSVDIKLSVDKDLQAIAEKYLKQTVVDFDAQKAGIGVMDAETGEILAIANYPTFDPNKFEEANANNRKLAFISDPIEPGSTFKVITVAAALENNIAKPETNYYCEGGKLLVDGHLITEAESRKKYEWLSVQEIISHSSNVGTSKIAFDLTFPKLREYIEIFNFGEKTGIEIPGESRGIFSEKENVSPLKLSNISFGQGVATTGIQMLSAYASIANGGNYIKPTILKVEDKSKIEKKRIISERTASQITGMLIEAVEHGTGANAKIPYFEIAGKTSTAQRPNSAGSYSGYVAGFVGFPTNSTQKFVIYVYVDDPKVKYYGNQVAAPVFKKVAQYLLYKNESFEKLSLKNDQLQKDQVKIINSSTITRVLGKGLAPNFIGLDKKSARKLADKLHLQLVHKGIGIVKEQLPNAGISLEDSGIVKLFYSPPEYE